MSYKKLGRVCEAVRRIDKSKEAQEVKNFEHPLYTESELGAMTKVQLQGLYLRFYGTDSGRLREGGLIKAILKAESELKNPAESTGTEKGERTMTKITEETLEGYQSEIETFKNRTEAESFLRLYNELCKSEKHRRFAS